ncbi:SprT-like domain-containing protein [Achromobacter xylosoxidans]|uniref:SprT-like domain-containing protein n=1 Tax=Achromobacter ruhlandii TaxID=72557 RepID=UPI003B9CBE70
MTMTSLGPLDPTRQAYNELQGAFDHYNDRLFGGKLPPCLITMQREKRTYGYFSSRRFVHRLDMSMTDEIAINPSYFGVVPLLEILQTIVHEMCHLWQEHFGKPGRRRYHNKEWADKMEAIGLMPSSTGRPGGARTGEQIMDYAMAGGAFMRATEELLTRDFCISWADRFPPPDSLHAAAPYVVPFSAITIAGDDDVPIGPSALSVASTASIAGQLGTAEDLAALAPHLVVRDPAQPNRSNRVKYRCPTCRNQVWGKPALRVLCGEADCKGVAFEAVDGLH